MMFEQFEVQLLEGAVVSRSWLYDYQTLIVGLLAVVVGAFAAYAAFRTIDRITRQINLQRVQIRDDRRRYRDATRSAAWQAQARLNDALNQLCRFAVQNLRYIRDGGTAPDPPTAGLDAVTHAIDAIGKIEPASGEALWELLKHYQQVDARLERYTSKVSFWQADPTQHAASFGDAQYECARFYAIAESMLNFARGQVEVAKFKEPLFNEVSRAYHNMLEPEEIAATGEAKTAFDNAVRRRHRDEMAN